VKSFDKQARQGDVFLVKTSEFPKNLEEIPRESGKVVLAHGEVTGHAHAISEKHVQHFRVANGAPSLEGARLRAGGGLPAETYLLVEEVCLLTHEEHAPIEIQPERYVVRRQREYVRGEIKRVTD
jgi:hypothetical protein